MITALLLSAALLQDAPADPPSPEPPGPTGPVTEPPAEESAPAPRPDGDPFAPVAAPQPNDPRWRTVDGVITQAGDSVVTLSSVFQHYAAVRDNLTVTTQEEYEAVMEEIRMGQVMDALEAQAGEDEELEPNQTERALDRFLESRQRERGLIEYTESLKEAGITAHGQRSATRDGFYAYRFRDFLVDGRPTRDTFVRPGEVRWHYETNRDRLGEPDQVQLQMMQFDPVQFGGLEYARAGAEDVLGRLQGGEDFALLHEEFSVIYRDSQGITPFFPITNLAPPIRDFLEGAQPGDMSPVLEGRRRDGDPIQGYLIVKLLDRQPGAPAPPFETLELQDMIVQEVENLRRNAHLGLARAELHRRAYLWPAPGSLQEPAPGPAAQALQATPESEAGTPDAADTTSTTPAGEATAGEPTPGEPAGTPTEAPAGAPPGASEGTPAAGSGTGSRP